MQLFKRIGYYLIGVALGTIAVAFFWKKKNASFDYGMDARTLKTIRIRKRLFTDEAKKSMKILHIDSLKIATILHHGDVDFSKSKPRQKPCQEYYITGKGTLETVHLIIKRCDSTATVLKVFIED